MAKSAVQVILEINARIRQLEPNAVITYQPGWETRGNGSAAAYIGGIVHHTAFISSLANPLPALNTLINGRPDLDGPLCNYAGPACEVKAPRLHVIAANPANHAGASGGRSMGPLPKTGLFNPKVLGLEIDYAGLTPMLPGQLYAAQLWARAVADVVAGGNIEAIRAHMETSITGKWDPGYGNGKTIDMAAFRKSAAAIKAGAGASVDIEEDDMPLIVNTKTKGIWVQDAIGYHWIAETATVKALQAAGAKSISISDREHANWVAAQTTIHTVTPDFDVDEVSLAKALVAAGFSGGASADQMADVVAARLAS